MCNQTEMYRDMYDYDRRAEQGLEHVRGIAHNPESCPKCQKEKHGKRKSKKIRSVRCSKKKS